MRKSIVALIVCFCVGLLTSFMHAEEWKSPDGLFSFILPEGFVRDQELPRDQYQLQHWTSEEFSCLLTAGKAEIPKNITQFQLSAFVEGTLQQFVDEQGKPLPDIKTIHSGSGKTKEGFHYYEAMASARIPELDLPVSVYQYAVLVNGTVYKLIFTSYDALPLEIPEIKNCITTINIHATPRRPSWFDGNDNKTAAERLGEAMGRLAFFCLLVAGINYMISRSRRPKTRRPGQEDMPFEN